MNCLKHPDTPSVGTCSGCAEPFCNNCLVTIKGQKYCADCKGMAVPKEGMAATAGHAKAAPAEAGEALKYALIGIICCGIILGPIAISKGIKARQIIAASPGMEGGGKALAAIIIGSIVLLLNILGIIIRVTAAGSEF